MSNVANQITLLATAPLIRSTGAQVQAYNYIARHYKKALLTPRAARDSAPW